MLVERNVGHATPNHEQQDRGQQATTGCQKKRLDEVPSATHRANYSGDGRCMVEIVCVLYEKQEVVTGYQTSFQKE